MKNCFVQKPEIYNRYKARNIHNQWGYRPPMQKELLQQQYLFSVLDESLLFPM